jgi:hypothetical protein
MKPFLHIKYSSPLVRIIDISPEDACYPYRFSFIGQIGHFDKDKIESIIQGFEGGTFDFEHPIKKIGKIFKVRACTFIAIKVEEVTE